MNYLEFELKLRRNAVSTQKTMLKRSIILAIFFPAAIMLNVSILYNDHTKFMNAISLGVVASCFIFHIVDWLITLDEYRSNKRILVKFEEFNAEVESGKWNKDLIDPAFGGLV